MLFREFKLSDEEQLQFAQTIGELIQQRIEGIYKITLDPKIADYLHATEPDYFARRRTTGLKS